MLHDIQVAGKSIVEQFDEVRDPTMSYACTCASARVFEGSHN